MHCDALVIVDPQVGFSAPGGSLARAYGVDEVQPIARAVVATEKFIAQVLAAETAHRCELILVRSQYRPGQFCQDRQSPLYNLCVPNINRDCNLLPGMTELAPTHEFVKTEHDACCNERFRQWSLGCAARGLERVLICGGLLEHCVAATALACKPHWAHVHLKPSLCGSRACKYEGLHSVVDQTLERLRAQGVVVDN